MSEKPKAWYEPHYSITAIKDHTDEEALKTLETFCDKKGTYLSKALRALSTMESNPSVTKARVLFVEYAMKEVFSYRDVLVEDQDLAEIYSALRYVTWSESEVEKLRVVIKAADEGIVKEKDVKLMDYKAKMEFALGNFAEAVVVLEARAKMTPEEITPLINKVVVMEARKEYEQALNLYEELKFRFPTAWKPLLLQGGLFMKLFKLDEALKNFELIAQMNETTSVTAVAYAYIGRVHYLHKDFSQARHFFEKAILEDQENPSAHHFQGDLYAFNNNWVDALYRYEKFAGLVNIHRDIKNRIRHAIDEKSNSTETKTSNLPTKKITQVTNYELERCLWIIVDHFRIGLYHPCLEYLKTVREILPKNAEIRIFLAKVYIMLNDNASAISELSAGLANINVAMSWQSHYSPRLNDYKQEILQKKAAILKLLIEIASIDIDHNVVPIMHARNRVFDQAFGVYKNKLMLKYSYLPGDPDFDKLLTGVREKISEFKQKVADPTSTLYIPFAIQNDKSLLLYYNTLLRLTSALEEINQKQGLGLGPEASGLHSVLKNAEPLIKYYSLTTNLKPNSINLKSSNINMLESSSAKRLALLKDLAQSFITSNSHRIIHASDNKEITLFIKEAFLGKYSQYFVNAKQKGSTANNVEQLARIDALKLLIILYNGMYDQGTGKTNQERVGEIQQMMEMPFAYPKKNMSCLCFKF
jgi:tetratricopeptide (TPR) repeat protein